MVEIKGVFYENSITLFRYLPRVSRKTCSPCYILPFSHEGGSLEEAADGYTRAAAGSNPTTAACKSGWAGVTAVDFDCGTVAPGGSWTALVVMGS